MLRVAGSNPAFTQARYVVGKVEDTLMGASVARLPAQISLLRLDTDFHDRWMQSPYISFTSEPTTLACSMQLDD